MKKYVLVLIFAFVLTHLFSQRVNVVYLNKIDTDDYDAPVSLFLNPQGDEITFIGDKNKVYIIRMNGIKISEIGKSSSSKVGRFKDPKDIFIDDRSKIYIADSDNNRVQVFNKNNLVVPELYFGELGEDNGKLKNPSGIWVDSEGAIYLSDKFNDRIQIYNSQGIFLMKIGKMGSKNGQLHRPIGIAVDSMGYIYVADSLNARIQVFDEEGYYYRTFNEKSMISPFDLFYDVANDLLYATDIESNQIFIFKNDGNLFAKFGSKGKKSGEFRSPKGIYATSNGKVYIADTGNERIQIFEIPDISNNKQNEIDEATRRELEKARQQELEEARKREAKEKLENYRPDDKQKVAIFNLEIIGEKKKLKSIRDTAFYELKRSMSRSEYFDVCLDEDVENGIQGLSLDPKSPISLKNSFIVTKNLLAQTCVSGAVTSYYVDVILTNSYTEEEIISSRSEFKRESEISQAIAKAIKSIEKYYYENKDIPVSVPTGLNTDSAIKSVEISWNKVKSNKLAGYNIYRSSDPDKKMKLVGITSTNNFIDRVPKVEEEYFYKITAVNIFGKESDMSILISGSGLPNPDLDPPYITKAEADNFGFSFEWERSGSEDTKGYKIYRSISKNGKFTKVGETSNLKFVNKRYIESNTKYYYYVTAYNSTLESKRSNVVEVTSNTFAELISFMGDKLYKKAVVWDGTGKNKKAIGSSIKCDKGIKVVLLSTKKKNGYYKVRTEDGREGWIYHMYFKLQ